MNVRDGSGYWQHRDKAELERQIEEWNSVIAAIAGAFKDGTEELDGQVVSAIFEAPDFERLEAKGHEVLQRKRQQRRKEPKSKPGKQA